MTPAPLRGNQEHLAPRILDASTAPRPARGRRLPAQKDHRPPRQAAAGRLHGNRPLIRSCTTSRLPPGLPASVHRLPMAITIGPCCHRPRGSRSASRHNGGSVRVTPRRGLITQRAAKRRPSRDACRIGVGGQLAGQSCSGVQISHLCVSFAVRCHRPCMGSAAGGRLLVLAAWAEGDARLLPGRPGSGGDSPCLVIAGLETADQMLSCGLARPRRASSQIRARRS